MNLFLKKSWQEISVLVERMDSGPFICGDAPRTSGYWREGGGGVEVNSLARDGLVTMCQCHVGVPTLNWYGLAKGRGGTPLQESSPGE